LNFLPVNGASLKRILSILLVAYLINCSRLAQSVEHSRLSIAWFYLIYAALVAESRYVVLHTLLVLLPWKLSAKGNCRTFLIYNSNFPKNCTHICKSLIKKEAYGKKVI